MVSRLAWDMYDGMIPDPDGDYVRVEDYERLREVLRQSDEELRLEWSGQKDELARLRLAQRFQREENDRLRERLARVEAVLEAVAPLAYAQLSATGENPAADRATDDQRVDSQP